jgi:hypothetical protein
MLWGITFMFQVPKNTNDSGIERIFEQECVLGSNDQRPTLTKLEEKLELDYGVFNSCFVA